MHFLEELILAEDEQAFFACLSRHYGRPIGFQELETLDGAAVVSPSLSAADQSGARGSSPNHPAPLFTGAL